MKRKFRENSFWVSYSDLMTSLFFITLVLFIFGIIHFRLTNEELEKYKGIVKADNDEKSRIIDSLQKRVDTLIVTNKQYEQIIHLEEQFKVLNDNPFLQYIPEKNFFVTKDLMGIELFPPNSDKLLDIYKQRVDSVGFALNELLKNLSNDYPNLRFQLVIEGYAAIPFKQLKDNNFNPDDYNLYRLSYNRSLALYDRWCWKGIDLRKYNTEIILAGSGFNGKNRDEQVEENNKRFVIQIIPKIQKPN